MDVLRVAALCVAGAVMSLTLKAQKPELAVGVALVTGLVAVMMVMPGLSGAVEVVATLSQGAGLKSDSAQLLIRATGVTLIVEFGAGLCKDAGESALASRIELGGRVALLAMAAPLLVGLTGELMRLLP